MKNQTTLMARIWADLSAINVNEHVQKKVNLSYLSWTWAWSTLMSKYPESYYVFEDHAENDGSVMVECVLTIHEGEEVATRTMWLPVMDHKNKAIINPNSRDISDTRMRCLVKCLAMFGLGFYIYAGEDIPQAEAEALTQPIDKDQAQRLNEMLDYSGTDVAKFLAHYKISSVSELPKSHYEQAYNALAQKIANMEAQTAQADEELSDVDL
jgi:hypothetical protein